MKTFKCSDIGKDCDYVARGKTEDEVFKQAYEHGKKDHGMKEEDFTPELKDQVRSKIRDENIGRQVA